MRCVLLGHSARREIKMQPQGAPQLLIQYDHFDAT
jgi:hypothetical protein